MFKNITKNFNEETEKQSEILKENNLDRWFGVKPHLRMCHTMLRNDVLAAYKEICRWEDREGIDGRNSSSRKKCFEELLSNAYNDPTWKPVSNVYPFSHDNFREAMELWGDDVPLGTPHKMSEKTSEARYKVRKYSKLP